MASKPKTDSNTQTHKIAPSKQWPIDDIKPYSHNPRTHPPAQIKLLAELMKKFGADQDIVVDENGVILKGHGRRLAAIEAGMKKYPVTQRFGLGEDDKAALRIADNQVALLSGWDTELVRFEIERLKRSDYPLELLGFGEAQLVQFTTTPSPPGSFQDFGGGVETAYCCPRCSYEWSGQPKPKKVEGDEAEEQAGPKPKAGARKKKAA